MKEIIIQAKLTKSGEEFFGRLKGKKAVMIFRKKDRLQYPNTVRVRIGKSKYSYPYHKDYWQPLCEGVEIKY